MSGAPFTYPAASFCRVSLVRAFNSLTSVLLFVGRELFLLLFFEDVFGVVLMSVSVLVLLGVDLQLQVWLENVICPYLSATSVKCFRNWLRACFCIIVRGSVFLVLSASSELRCDVSVC